jgi:glycosyltransferase involved in cell wall biosynthesis
MKYSICQLASGHSVEDERILHRMARTAHDFGYTSFYIVPHDGTAQDPDVQLVPIPKTKKRLGKLARSINGIRQSNWILKNKMDLVQIHDPDLLPVAFLLKLFGRKVIYDVHDDYEASIKDRLANRKRLRTWMPGLWWRFEHWISRRLDGVIVADRHLAEKFKRCDPVILGNYPRLNFTEKADTSLEDTFNLIYVGGVTEARGVGIALEAIRQIKDEKLRFHIIGACRDETLLARLKEEPRVVLHGRVPWLELKKYYQRAHLGIALYQPLECFMYCPGENAVKVLEYMAAGIPVLTANFPGLKTFVEDQGVGLTVPPDSVEMVRKGIERLIQDSGLRQKLGDQGRMLFESEYNWEKHQGKLIGIYAKVISKS